jgi:hypothetical protein
LKTLLVIFILSRSSLIYSQGITIDDIREFQNIKFTENILQTLSSPYFDGRDIRSKTINRTQTFLENIFITYNVKALYDNYRVPYKIDESAKGHNLVGIYRGNDRKKSAILITANYDNLGKKVVDQYADSIYHGVNDNATGVSALIQLIIFIDKNRPKENIIFAFTSGKTINNIGAGFLADTLKKQTTLKINYAINIDKIGRPMYNSGINLLSMQDTLNSLASNVNEYIGSGFLLVDTSREFSIEYDHSAIFNILKIPTMTFTSFNYGNDENFMTVNDNMDNIDLNYLHRTTARITFAIYKLIQEEKNIGFNVDNILTPINIKNEE